MAKLVSQDVLQEILYNIAESLATKSNVDHTHTADDVGAVATYDQELTEEQITTARANIRVIGKQTEGMEFYPYTVDEANDYAYIYDDLNNPSIAQFGAEIYNDYDNNIAVGLYSKAEGFKTQAIGNYSHTTGWWTRASGQCAVANGLLSIASGHFTHAEGTRTQATINNAHSEGDLTVASGRQSHAEGTETVASGMGAHSEGVYTKATGRFSHAEGWGTIAAGENQTTMGKYNVSDTSSALIIGRGTSNTARKNAFKVSKAGVGWFAGDIYVGSTGGITQDDGSKKVATEEFVTNSIDAIEVMTVDEFNTLWNEAMA